VNIGPKLFGFMPFARPHTTIIVYGNYESQMTVNKTAIDDFEAVPILV
jgi:hypothetical protein